MSTAQKTRKTRKTAAAKPEIKAPNAHRFVEGKMKGALPAGVMKELKIYWKIEDHTGLYVFGRNIKTPDLAEKGTVAALAPTGLAQFVRAKDAEAAFKDLGTHGE